METVGVIGIGRIGLPVSENLIKSGYRVLGYRRKLRDHTAETPVLDRMTLLQALGVGVLGYYVASMLDFSALGFISAQLDRLILLTYPFFVVLFGMVFFGRRVTPLMVASLLVSYLGIALIFGHDFSIEGDDVVRDVTDQAGAQGVGPGFPIFDDAVAAFRAANAARFVAESDDDGRFTLKDVPAGQYTLHVEREGFFDLRARSGNPVKLNVAGQQTITTSVSMTPGHTSNTRMPYSASRTANNCVIIRTPAFEMQ